jgi:glycosyltransferase involved in cell wall biosynthesis
MDEILTDERAIETPASPAAGVAAPAAVPAHDARIVITHDFMETYGGAERVTAEMAAVFPEAQVYSLLARPEVSARMGVADRARSLVSPRSRTLEHYRLGAPVWGRFTDSVRLPEADVVLASSYAYAHRLRTANDAPVVCYCHSPLRFAWSMTEAYRDRWARTPGRGRAFDALVSSVRRGDHRAAQRVHTYLTQSPFTAEQIWRFYGREADVIGAPVDCGLFRPDPDLREPDDYYLLVSRLVEPYKRVGAAIEAFRDMPHLRLVIAGDGPAAAELRAAAPPNVEFVGRLEDAPLVELMQRCRAALFPSCDDFGLVPVEVMACGRPVLAYGAGGALHTVRPGVTGELFSEQTPQGIRQALQDFEPEAYDSAAIRDHALRWDRLQFRARLVAAVRRAIPSHGKPTTPLFYL